MLLKCSIFHTLYEHRNGLDRSNHAGGSAQDDSEKQHPSCHQFKYIRLKGISFFVFFPDGKSLKRLSCSVCAPLIQRCPITRGAPMRRRAARPPPACQRAVVRSSRRSAAVTHRPTRRSAVTASARSPSATPSRTAPRCSPPASTAPSVFNRLAVGSLRLPPSAFCARRFISLTLVFFSSYCYSWLVFCLSAVL